MQLLRIDINTLKRQYIAMLMVITLYLMLSIQSVSAHPGRTADDGCHYCRTNCEKWEVPPGRRHCHGNAIQNNGTSHDEHITPDNNTLPEATSHLQAKCPPTTGIWRDITLASECRCSTYNRQDYPYSGYIENNIVSNLEGMYSPYDNTTFMNLHEADIEHIVALSEAHDSGLCASDDSVRRAFASDLDNLTLASPTINRQKGSRDAAEWIPALNRCWFAISVVKVRQKYNLTIDLQEAAALDAILAKCTEEQFTPSNPITTSSSNQ